MKYRREIDGLRAVAVLPVIFFHAGFNSFAGGYVGVDVFFVISGYLITTILINDLEAGQFSLVRFYERRARRILPALFFMMICCLPFAWAWMLPSQLKDFSQALMAVSLFASNILFWRKTDYFAPAAEENPLLHTWSLAVEEQFYIFFPILLWLLWRYGRGRVFWVIVGLCVISLGATEWGWRHAPAANFYLIVTRAWELGAGAICAFVLHARALRAHTGFSAFGLGLILVSVWAFDADTPFPSLYTLVPVVGTALIICFAGHKTLVGKLLSLRVFVGIGLISYSAYLWHQPLFAFARLRSLQEPGLGLMLTLAAVAFLLAWITWYFIEQPFRRRLINQTTVFAASGAVGALFAAMGLAGHLGEGFAWRLPEADARLYATAAPSPMRNRCHYGPRNEFAEDESCIYFGDTADVAIYGNSHGVELAYGLAERLRDEGRSLVQYTISGCDPGFQRELEPYCSTFYSSRLNRIMSQPEIQHVVLTYRTDTAGPDGSASVVELANFLHEAGKQVVIVLQAPILPHHVSLAMRSAFMNDAADVRGLNRNEWNRTNRHMQAALADLNPAVQVFDPANHFCDLQYCYAIREQQAMFFDNNHMSIYGARRIAGPLVDLLR